jgi:hypothetical protein
MSEAGNGGDLDVLAPEPASVKVAGGEVIAISPFFFGQWPRALKLFRPITEAVQKAGIAGFNGKGLSLAPDWVLRLPAVMDEAGEALLEFVGFAIGKPRAFFDTLGGDDGIALTKAVFEVNTDFFVRKIAPMLGLAIKPTPVDPAPADGAASSPDSSPADTLAPTSTE